MGLFDNLFGKKPAAKPSIPTVKFDSKRVSPAVVAQVKEDIRGIVDIPPGYVDCLHEAAVQSIAKGRALGDLKTAIIGFDIDGMTAARSAEIARLLHDRATSRMKIQEHLSLGVTSATWAYSGAPCNESNAAHKAADGKRYDLADGLWVGGKWTWPGIEPGCKCIDRPSIKGFS